MSAWVVATIVSGAVSLLALAGACTALARCRRLRKFNQALCESLPQTLDGAYVKIQQLEQAATTKLVALAEWQNAAQERLARLETAAAVQEQQAAARAEEQQALREKIANMRRHAPKGTVAAYTD